MSLAPGTCLGPYEVIARLGAGGMGEVYKARDTRLDRLVAIKVLAPKLAGDPQFRERFDREARVISRLDHPHICALYDVGVQHPSTPSTGSGHSGPARAFLVMQYLEGETLAARLAQGALAVDDALQLAAQIASALDAAHRAGVVHRDLKPGNVMLVESAHRASPHAKLLDFGVAKRVEAHASAMDAQTVADAHTAHGLIVGTTKYLSPEQARGLPVDGRSDLFSLGVVVYEMLAGRAAFDAPTAADIVVAILERHPEPVARFRPDTPPHLQQIIAKCLEKNAERRYSSARDLMNDLGQVIEERSGHSSAAKSAPSIAVLPFVNMSTDPENEYFCDGIAEDLISALTKIEQLRVAARTSAFSFKGKGAELKDVGRSLNVNTVLEGSVRKAGGRLRVTAQLVNIADGYQLWSEQYDRQLEDVFAIQDEISLAIVNALKVKLLGEEEAAIGKHHTENIEAYQLYLKGRHHWHKWTPEGFAKSKECIERAIALDPEYALAYYGLADVYLGKGAAGLLPYTELVPQARDALTRALAIDPELPEALTLMSVVHFFEWDWAASDRASTHAIELNPRLGHAYLERAVNHVCAGRSEAALPAAQRAVELDPLTPLWNYFLVLAYMARGDSASAQRQTDALLDIDPSFWFAHQCRGVLAVARGQYADASEGFADAVRYSGGAPYAVGLFACASGLAGERDRAERELAALLDRASNSYVPALGIALAYVGLKSTDHAFEWLERSFEERDLWLLFEVLYLRQLDGLRKDPRMTDLRRRIAKCGVKLNVE